MLNTYPKFLNRSGPFALKGPFLTPLHSRSALAILVPHGLLSRTGENKKFRYWKYDNEILMKLYFHAFHSDGLYTCYHLTHVDQACHDQANSATPGNFGVLKFAHYYY